MITMRTEGLRLCDATEGTYIGRTGRLWFVGAWGWFCVCPDGKPFIACSNWDHELITPVDVEITVNTRIKHD